jgi:predicted house-cleaning NTP pyrophosphatase (Maf/HAM1 superfamily)
MAPFEPRKSVRCGAAAPHTTIAIHFLASDTVVSLEGESLGNRAMRRSPIDAAAAARTVHQVCGDHADRSARPIDRSPIWRAATSMRAYTDEEIEAYIASGDPFDKAGAYAIQHNGFHPVENFAQCFANVMGLPLCHVVRSLRQLGVEVPNDVPTLCQAHIRYECPVFERILTSDGPTGTSHCMCE